VLSLAALTTVAALFLGTPALASGAPASGSAPAQSSTSVTGDSCNGVFHGSPSGSLAETSSAGPNGSIVATGQQISVTLKWNPTDFSGNTVDKTDVCVKIGTQISSALSQEHKPGPGAGTDVFSFVLPTQGTGGQPICVRTAVSGSGAGSEKSNVVCYSELDSVAPEVPYVLLLPLAFAVVVAGAFFLRRPRGRAQHAPSE